MTALPQADGWRPTHGQAVAGLLLLGLLVRLAIAPYGGHHFDIPTFQFWTYHLVRDPLSEFYHLRQQFLPEQDHLPGDLWILWLLGQIFRLFSPELDVETPGFVWMLKAVPALSDTGIAWLLYLVGRELRSRNVGLLAATAYAFNPGPIFLTSVWGQWDAVSAFFALLAFWLYLRGRFGWVLPALTYATLVKPQFAALFPLFALAYYIAYVRRAPGDEGPRPAGYWSEVLTPVVAGAVISFLLAAVLLLPFGVGLFGIGEWSIVERMRIAVDLNKWASLYAFNLWTAVKPPTSEWQADDVAFLFGVTYQTWGAVLTIVAYGAILLQYARRPRPLGLLWAMLAILLTLYILPTRIHERYMLPALVFGALPAVIDVTYRRLYLAMSFTYFVNISFVYLLNEPPRLVASLSGSGAFYVVMSVANVAILAVMLVRGAPRIEGEEAEAAEVERPEIAPAEGLATAPPG